MTLIVAPSIPNINILLCPRRFTTTVIPLYLYTSTCALITFIATSFQLLNHYFIEFNILLLQGDWSRGQELRP